LLRLNYPNYQIVVVDNASADDSIDRLRAWATGQVTTPAPQPPEPLQHLLDAPRTPPAPFIELDRIVAEQGGTSEARAARLLLIRNEQNLGFAGGNNVGMRYAIATRRQAPNAESYVCLLNNDTVVARDWLSRMMDVIQPDESIGAAGAMLYEYYAPNLVESAGGGVVYPWQGMPRATSAHRQERGTPAAVPRRLDFLSGACMLMRTSTLERVGLIDERYFIYCEDIDLSLRIRKLGLRLTLVPTAEMWHKNGGIMGTLTARRDYYMVRNSLLLVHKLYPAMVPPAVAFSLYRCALPKLLRGDWTRLGAVGRAYRDFFMFAAGHHAAAGVGESVPART
jgi:GT2 family glycosyltransferase